MSDQVRVWRRIGAGVGSAYGLVLVALAGLTVLSFMTWAGGPPDGAACIELAPPCADFWDWVHDFPDWWFPTIGVLVTGAVVFIGGAVAWYWLDERRNRPDPE